MTERDAMEGFETRLAGLLRTHTQPAAGPIDPLATARASMTAAAPGVLARWRAATPDRRLVNLLLAAALVIALALISIVVGALLTPPSTDDPGRLLFVRDGDLYVADIDGSGQTRIAEGGADGQALGYVSALWSPDGSHIAASRDTGGEFLTPAVDLLTADGALVRTVALDSGCRPSITWAPDSAEVAIATCPADVPRDSLYWVAPGTGLLVAALDPAADREIELPPEWASIEGSNPEVWTVADLFVKWSPAGRWIALWALSPGGASQHLVAADASGTRSVDELVEGRGFANVEMLNWSGDGRRVAIVGN